MNKSLLGIPVALGIAKKQFGESIGTIQNRIATDALRMDPEQLIRAAIELEKRNQRLRTLDDWIEDGVLSLIVSASQLREARDMLVPDAAERIALLEGHRVGKVSVVTRIRELGYEYRSVAGAMTDPACLTRAMVENFKDGLSTLAIFHSHPGKGESANRPSQTDLDTHAAWESGSPVVGGIYCQLGHLRFFTKKTRFQILVSGEGVKNTGEHQYFIH